MKMNTLLKRTVLKKMGRVYALLAVCLLAIVYPEGSMAYISGCIFNGDQPLAGYYVRFDGRSYMTDSQGCVAVGEYNWGGTMDVMVYANNRMVSAGSQYDTYSEEVSIGSDIPESRISAAGSPHFYLAEVLRGKYYAGLRDFPVWTYEERLSPGIKSSLLNTDDDERSHVIPFNGLLPLMNVRAGDLENVRILQHQLAHYLHYSELSDPKRTELQDMQISNGLSWPCALHTNDLHGRERAFIEAFGIFGEVYPDIPQDPAGDRLIRHRYFFESAESMIRSLPDVSGEESAEAVFAALFVNFAGNEAIGLDFVVDSYVDCGAFDIQEYAECLVNRYGSESVYTYALAEAGAEWGIQFDSIHILYKGLMQAEDGTGEWLQSGDEFGGAMASGDFDGDGLADLIVGGPGKNGSSGAVFVYYGSEFSLGSGHVLTQSDAGRADGELNRFGHSVAAGDFNCDGYDDIAVGAPWTNENSGAVSIWYGSSDGIDINSGRTILQDELGSSVTFQIEPGDRLGWAVTTGNFNNDSFMGRSCDDLAASSPGENGVGVVHVLKGSTDGLNPYRILWKSYSGEGKNVSGDMFGYSLASGDINNDGSDDLIVGVPGESISSYNTYQGWEKFHDGAVAVFYGWSETETYQSYRPFTGGGILDQAVACGENLDGDAFGFSLAVGDFNGDTFSDIAVGAPTDHVGGIQSGAAYVLWGSSDGIVLDICSGIALDQTQIMNTSYPYEAYTNDQNDMFGLSLMTFDRNADGIDDLVVGTPGERVAQYGGGSVYIFNGNNSGLTGSVGMNVLSWQVTGEMLSDSRRPGIGRPDSPDGFGASLASGDFDGDGSADLAIGAPGELFGGYVYLNMGSE